MTVGSERIFLNSKWDLQTQYLKVLYDYHLLIHIEVQPLKTLSPIVVLQTVLFIAWLYRSYKFTNSTRPVHVWCQIPNLNQNLSNIILHGIIYLFTYDQYFRLDISTCDDHEGTFRA